MATPVAFTCVAFASSIKVPGQSFYSLKTSCFVSLNLMTRKIRRPLQLHLTILTKKLCTPTHRYISFFWAYLEPHSNHPVENLHVHLKTQSSTLNILPGSRTAIDYRQTNPGRIQTEARHLNALLSITFASTLPPMIRTPCCSLAHQLAINATDLKLYHDRPITKIPAALFWSSNPPTNGFSKSAWSLFIRCPSLVVDHWNRNNINSYKGQSSPFISRLKQVLSPGTWDS